MSLRAERVDIMTSAAINPTTATANDLLHAEMDKMLSYEAQKISPYATNAMRRAIIQKSLDGRTKAIDAGFCEKNGTKKESLDSWKYNVNSLYEAAVCYSRAIGTQDEADRHDELLRIWKLIIKVGDEDRFHPNMFIREKDTENLRVLAAESTQEHIPGIGFVPTLRGKESFRGLIETRIALRIAGNATLNDADRDTVTDYRKAVKVIKQTKDVLLGYTDKQGNQIPSLDDQIEGATTNRDEIRQSLTDAGIDPETINRATAKYDAEINKLKEAEKSAVSKLEKWLKVEENLRPNYKEIVARLDKIEDVQPGAKNSDVSIKARRDAVRAKLMNLELE